MIKRILNAYLIEISRAIRLKSTFFGPTLMIIIILLTPFAYPIQQDNDSDYDFLVYLFELYIYVFVYLLFMKNKIVMRYRLK